MSPLETAKQVYKRKLAYESKIRKATKAAYETLQLKQDALNLCNQMYETNIAREEAEYESFKEHEKQRHPSALEEIEQLYKQKVAGGRAAVTASEEALEVASKQYEVRLVQREAAGKAREGAATEYKQLKQQAEASATEQYAVLRESTLITSGAGLEVQNVVAGFDTCRITIKNLPKKVKGGDVSEIFIQQGMVHSEFLVLNLRSKENHWMLLSLQSQIAAGQWPSHWTVLNSATAI
jgi:hypothetical protein